MYKKWIVYIVRCSDSSLYTGITTDIERRIKEHNSSKKGASYTSTRRPVVLCYTEDVMTKSEALKRELEIKKMKKRNKEDLIK